ncbi:hypothetical protein EDC94DRAFT_650326 [Helicostylum pulchrum]|nr:hypothetical protein EDC94DRAFT_650326 [Helicostylum pulchrum]
MVENTVPSNINVYKNEFLFYSLINTSGRKDNVVYTTYIFILFYFQNGLFPVVWWSRCKQIKDNASYFLFGATVWIDSASRIPRDFYIATGCLKLLGTSGENLRLQQIERNCVVTKPNYKWAIESRKTEPCPNLLTEKQAKKLTRADINVCITDSEDNWRRQLSKFSIKYGKTRPTGVIRVNIILPRSTTSYVVTFSL